MSWSQSQMCPTSWDLRNYHYRSGRFSTSVSLLRGIEFDSCFHAWCPSQQIGKFHENSTFFQSFVVRIMGLVWGRYHSQNHPDLSKGLSFWICIENFGIAISWHFAQLWVTLNRKKIDKRINAECLAQYCSLIAHYRVGKFAFFFMCTVHAPLEVSIAHGRACIFKRKFSQCVGGNQ